MEPLLLAGAAASAAAAVLSLLAFLFRNGRRITRYFEAQAQDLATVKRHDREQYLAILRLTIVSQEMPITERIKAGDEYIKAGGNGAVQRLYEQLLEEQPYCREEDE